MPKNSAPIIINKQDMLMKSSIKKNTQFEMLKRLQLSPKDFFKISKLCKKLNIEFCLSCFDTESLKILKETAKKHQFKIPFKTIKYRFIYVSKILY